MKVKVFMGDKDGKITFTRVELERVLNEVYNEGYSDGMWKSTTWTTTTATPSTSPLTIQYDKSTTFPYTINSGDSITTNTTDIKRRLTNETA